MSIIAAILFVQKYPQCIGVAEDMDLFLFWNQPVAVYKKKGFLSFSSNVTSM